MQFQSIPESDNRFLALFPHRHDYLWAEHAAPGVSPDWRTEDKHTLSDRMIEQGAKLYGVRFGHHTSYAMLDIDRNSPYHPKRDRFATGRIFEAMEMLGLTNYLTVTSSYSEGIHIYFPLPSSLESWKVAAVCTQLLTYKGFLVEDGLLEIFPNNRNYDTDGNTTLFKGHRLPLQAGSYLIDESWQLQWTTQELFVRHWNFAAARNTINQPLFNRLLSEATRKFRKLTFKAEKFLNDLHTEIEPGWTGSGQTNYLLGRITLRAYIFGHYLQGGEPLKGDRLVQEIVKTATALPGYEEFCGHKTDIWSRAEDWGQCVENSRYYPYGKSKPKEEAPKPQPITWNEWHRKRARERLCFAIADLLNQGRLPSGITERFQIFTREYGFSGETLYHHADLWHPEFFVPVENPPAPPQSGRDLSGSSAEGATALKHAKSLLAKTDRNPTSTADQDWFKGWDFTPPGCNEASGNGFSYSGPTWRVTDE